MFSYLKGIYGALTRDAMNEMAIPWFFFLSFMYVLVNVAVQFSLQMCEVS